MHSAVLLRAGRTLAVGLFLALGSQAAAAQLLPAANAQKQIFMTLTSIEAPTRKMAKLLFAPAFNGHTEIQLEAVGALSAATVLEQLRQNNETLAQTLGELSAAGWELVQVSPAPLMADKDVATTRYLLRKAKE